VRGICARGELERSRKRWSNDHFCLRMLIACAIFLFLSTPCCAAQNAATGDGRRAGTLSGTVSTGTENSLYAGAKVQASGSVTMQTQTNGEGQFAFNGLPAGTYRLTANAPGLEAEQTVTLRASQVVQVSLQLKPVRTTTTIDVGAADTAQKTPAPTQTIGEKTLRDAPNVNERFETLLPLVPGVVRGPDGHINMKGARNTQSGALVNSANVTDPATGSPAMNLPIDVVSSVEVVSNPYDPQYGKFTGAVSSVETKTGNYEKYHYSIQNVLPRWRDRDGSIVGIGAATPRATFTGPLVRDKLAFTQSLEYRFLRTPVNSLPPLERDTTLESVDSYTQGDLKISPTQTATVSLAVFPQKFKYMGLNTFTPQPATADLHQRGYQVYAQHHFLTGDESALISQVSYKTYDADVSAQSDDPYQLFIETTEGGYFNRQARRTWRLEWQESYQFAPRHFLGTHEFKAGLNYAHSSYDGRQMFLPVELIGVSGLPIEHITFTPPTSFGIDQDETAWFAADQWSPSNRVTLDLGLRFDNDTVTGATHVAPRAGFILALTNDSKTLLKGGVGMFYDRVPLMYPVFEHMPKRTVSTLDEKGEVSSATAYVNRVGGGLHNPESISWNAALERQILERLTIKVAYEQRNTTKDFTVSPVSGAISSITLLSNAGRDSYREYQVAGRYRADRFTLNGSYVRSRAYGNLNDPTLFFGNDPQAVIQTDARARLPFDAPNRWLFWADISGPKKFTLIPVWDLHTGFPYSPEDQFREYVGPRNTRRYPRLSSMDLQVSRPFSLHVGEKRRLQVRAGFGVFNTFNHFNPRDVQNNLDSSRFGEFFNDAWREYRGKFVFQF
jgi:outer membrane receptor protein involved in Fe transport